MSLLQEEVRNILIEEEKTHKDLYTAISTLAKCKQLQSYNSSHHPSTQYKNNTHSQSTNLMIEVPDMQLQTQNPLTRGTPMYQNCNLMSDISTQTDTLVTNTMIIENEVETPVLDEIENDLMKSHFREKLQTAILQYAGIDPTVHPKLPKLKYSRQLLKLIHIFNNNILMVDKVWESQKNYVKYSNKDKEAILDTSDKWRRQCGCIKTSEKLRQILDSFPAPPPPTPISAGPSSEPPPHAENCISAFCTLHQPAFPSRGEEYKVDDPSVSAITSNENAKEQVSKRSWRVLTELVQLVQLSVTATALALYYLIYCYMQLVYYTLRSALYFHQADGPMKITIGVVTLTSLIVGFNLLLRMERLLFIFY
ncbi:unnamed protein product [Parnassius mnemosyne]|uniref:Uncharacterized protein n=1 Tax=Parnassius mnemosyne TaxID=213953 RepID=A0AAV1KJU9_9NEOP